MTTSHPILLVLERPIPRFDAHQDPENSPLLLIIVTNKSAEDIQPCVLQPLFCSCMSQNAKLRRGDSTPTEIGANKLVHGQPARLLGCYFIRSNVYDDL